MRNCPHAVVGAVTCIIKASLGKGEEPRIKWLLLERLPPSYSAKIQILFK